MTKLKDATTEREQFLRDVLTTAVEGGIGYWGRIYDNKRSEDLSWVSIEVVEFDDAAYAVGAHSFSELDVFVESGDKRIDPHKHHVDTKVLARTIRKICSREVIPQFDFQSPFRKQVIAAYMTLDAGDIDADIADVIVQLAALGEVRYG